MDITKPSTSLAAAALLIAVSVPLAQAQQAPPTDNTNGAAPPPPMNNTNTDNTNGAAPPPPTNNTNTDNTNGAAPPPTNNTNGVAEPTEPTTPGVVLQRTYDLSGFPNPEILVLMDTAQVGDISRGHLTATLPSEVTGNGQPQMPWEQQQNGQQDEITDTGSGFCQQGDNPYPGLVAFVGVIDPGPTNSNGIDNGNGVNNDTGNDVNGNGVGNGTRLVPVTLTNTGIGFRTVDFAGAQVASCVFHADIALDELGAPPAGNDEPNGANGGNGVNGTSSVQRITDVVFVNAACSDTPNECPLPDGASISVTVELDGAGNGNGIDNGSI